MYIYIYIYHMYILYIYNSFKILCSGWLNTRMSSSIYLILIFWASLFQLKFREILLGPLPTLQL